MNRTICTICTLLLCVSLVPAAAFGEQSQGPATVPPAAPKAAAPDKQTPPAKTVESPAPNSGAKAQVRGQAEAPSPGPGIPEQGSAWISPQPASPTASVPLAYPATRIETASRVDDLMRDAAALRGQGNLSKAMALYNEALALAPQYAETYRQRA